MCSCSPTPPRVPSRRPGGGPRNRRGRATAGGEAALRCGGACAPAHLPRCGLPPNRYAAARSVLLHAPGHKPVKAPETTRYALRGCVVDRCRSPAAYHRLLAATVSCTRYRPLQNTSGGGQGHLSRAARRSKREVCANVPGVPRQRGSGAAVNRPMVQGAGPVGPSGLAKPPRQAASCVAAPPPQPCAARWRLVCSAYRAGAALRAGQPVRSGVHAPAAPPSPPWLAVPFRRQRRAAADPIFIPGRPGCPVGPPGRLGPEGRKAAGKAVLGRLPCPAAVGGGTRGSGRWASGGVAARGSRRRRQSGGGRDGSDGGGPRSTAAGVGSGVWSQIT